MLKEGICTLVVGGVMYGMFLCTSLVVPFDVNKSDVWMRNLSNRIVQRFQVDEQLVNMVVKVSLMEGMDPRLVLALIYSESSFNPYVVSSKGYHGLLQVKWRVPYSDVNVVLGIKVLKEKLQQESGDLRRALFRYKGYDLDSVRGRYVVDKVLVLYQVLKDKISI